MQTFLKKKVEFVVEQPRLRTLLDLLAYMGVSGYTVLPTVLTRGSRGIRHTDEWRDDNDHLVVVIASESTARHLMAAAVDLLRGGAGIVTMCDVEVARDDKF